jgi:cytoskeletal protein RodZ
MQTLGDYLKKGRESRNISLSDISDYTKISKLYLDGLENDDYTKMPAELYVKGYISSYASCIGIDEHEALKLYESFQIKTSDAEEIQSGILQDNKDSKPPFFRRSRLAWLVFAFCILIMAAIGAYYSFFQIQESAPVNKRFEEQNKTVPPEQISTTESDLPQKRQDENSFQPIIQDDVAEKLESKEVGTQNDDGISQNPEPLEIHRPVQISKDSVPDQPINEISKVKELPGAANDQSHFKSDIKVLEAVACTSIENRIPQGLGDSFEWSVDRIIIWTRLQSERPPSSIRHIYYFKGQKVNDILLNIRSSHWRTWSYKTLSNKRYIGPWRVDITSADGQLLQSVHFEIK